MKTGFHIAISSLIMGSAFVVGDALSTGYPLKNGLGHGIIFGVLFTVFLFPVSLGVGHLIVAISKVIGRVPESITAAIESYFHVPFSIAFLVNGFQVYNDDGYRRYVSDDRPPSLQIEARDVRSAMGFRMWMFALAVDPAEEGMIFSRYKYNRDELSAGEVQESLQTYRSMYANVSLPSAEVDFSDRFSYSVPDAGTSQSAGFEQVIFTSDPPGRVLVFGSDD